MNFSLLKVINRADKMSREDYEQYIGLFIKQLESVTCHIENRSNITIEMKRQEFTAAVLLDSIKLIQQANEVSC